MAHLGGYMMDGNLWQARSVLVTGAAGFVGSWLTQALVERGAAVSSDPAR